MTTTAQQQVKREPIVTDEDMVEGAKMPVLGPMYFATRRFVEKSIAGDSSIDVKTLAKRFSDEVYEQILYSLENYLISNAESNVQTYLTNAVDEAVNALLAGHRWGLERYCLSGRYNAAEVRAAIASHIPEEIKGRRIADLEQQVKNLGEEVARLRARESRP